MIHTPVYTGTNGVIVLHESPTARAPDLFMRALEDKGIKRFECYEDFVINWTPYNTGARNFPVAVAARGHKIRERIKELDPILVICFGKFARRVFSHRLEDYKLPSLIHAKWKQMSFDLIISDWPQSMHHINKILSLIDSDVYEKLDKRKEDQAQQRRESMSVSNWFKE